MLLLIGLVDFKKEKKNFMAVNTPEFRWSNTRHTELKVLRTRFVTKKINCLRLELGNFSYLQENYCL